MNDVDLLDLLEIVEALLEDLPEAPADSRAYRMIRPFRTAIRQRMAEKAGEV